MKRLVLLASIAVGLIVTAGIAIAATGPQAPTTLAQVSSTTSADITTYQVADAGTVDVAFDGSSVAVVGVAPASGWSFETEVAAGIEVEVQFADGVTRVDFKAEVEDGQVRATARSRQATGDGTSSTTTSVTSTTLVDTSTTSTSSTTSTTSTPPSAGALTIDASPAGSVTVALNQGTVDVVSVDSNPGWTWSSERRLDGGVEVKFRNGSVEVEVEVEMEHGQMVPKVEVETDSDDDSDDDNSGRGNADDDDSDDDNSGHGGSDDD